MEDELPASCWNCQVTRHLYPNGLCSDCDEGLSKSMTNPKSRNPSPSRGLKKLSLDPTPTNKPLDKILHGHANWAHRWDKEPPTTYIYGTGGVIETVEAKQQILTLIATEREKLIAEFEQAMESSLKGKAVGVPMCDYKQLRASLLKMKGKL